jgi:divalent metal cation (Fe/Co/Zn/Cd) transporter
VHTLPETAEARAQKFVAVTLFLLARYIVYDAITTLADRDHARTSWLGIGLAVAVLAGLLANTLLGWWWLDPVVALGIAGLAVREGVEAWHGEECC